MEINMNGQLIRKLREERAWSQEHLASVANVSLRTIQRVESEGRASAETRLALAAAFDIDVSQLSNEEADTLLPEPSGCVDSRSGKKISWQQYRLLRFCLVGFFLLGLDLYQTHSITWSRWPLFFGGLFLGLRYLRSRFVMPRES